MALPKRPPKAGPVWWSAVGAVAVATVAAFVMRGLAGDEEAAHFLAARFAPQQWELFLHIAARPLVTLGLTVPAQFGFPAARLASAVVTGLCAFAVARTAVRAGWSPGWTTAFLLVQPFFLAHTGTTMTEPWTGCLLAWLALAVIEKRAATAGILAMLLPLARMELIVFWPLVAAALVASKSWRWIGVFPLGLALWAALGWASSGDPMWLVRQANASPYPARESLHYLKSAVWIFGLGVFVPTVVGISTLFARTSAGAWRRPLNAPAGDRTVLVSVTGLVVLGLVYTAAAAWRPVSFGNLRYLAFAAPFVAWLSAAGVHRLRSVHNRVTWIALAVAGIGALVLWNHPLINNFTILNRRDWMPAVVVAVWIAFYASPVRWRVVAPALVVALGVLGLARDHRPTLHFKLDPERAAVAEAAGLVNPDHRRPPVTGSHPLMAFYLGGNPHDAVTFPKPSGRFADLAAPGTVWFWETHYAPRGPGALDVGELLKPGRWRYLSGVASSDSTWLGAFLIRAGFEDGGEADGAATAPWLRRSDLDADRFVDASREAVYKITHFRRILEREPTSTAAWSHLTNAYLTAGRPQEALAALDRAESLGATSVENTMLRGAVLNRLGRFDEAAEAGREAVRKRPNDPNYQFLLGMFLWGGGHREEAAGLILGAARRLPENPEIRFLAGEVHRDAGRWAEAESHYEASVAVRPKHEASAIRSAECAWAQGKKEQAEKRLRSVVDRTPATPEPYGILAGALAVMGRVDEAREVLRKGIGATGGDPGLVDKLRQLEP